MVSVCHLASRGRLGSPAVENEESIIPNETGIGNDVINDIAEMPNASFTEPPETPTQTLQADQSLNSPMEFAPSRHLRSGKEY